jgi:O-antigen/teichoic acid export membrane protein
MLDVLTERIPFREFSASNAFYLIAGQIVTRLLGLGMTMILTRHLGPDKYGDLTLAYAYWNLFAGLIEAGLDLTIIREASQNPARLGQLVGNGILLRGLFALSSTLLAIALVPFLGYDPTRTRLLRLAALLLLFSPFAVSRTIFLVTLKIKLVAVLDVIGQLINTAFVISLVLIGNYQTYRVLLMKIAGLAFTQCLYLVSGRRLLSQPLSFRPDWRLWGVLLKKTAPLAIAGAFHAIQAHVSRLLVGRMLTPGEGGQHTVAMNLSTTFSFLPTLYCSSIYPLLSRYHQSDQVKFRQLYRSGFKTVMVIALPLALLTSLTAKEIITLYAGKAYLPSTSLFVALAWTMVPQFAGPVLYYTVLAAGQQHFFSWASAMSLLVRVGLYGLLLPRLGIIGAAFAVWATYSVSFGIYGTLKATRIYVIDWLHSILRPGVALIFTATLLIFFRPSCIAVWLGGLTSYILLLFLLYGFKRSDIKYLDSLLTLPNAE